MPFKGLIYLSIRLCMLPCPGRPEYLLGSDPTDFEIQQGVQLALLDDTAIFSGDANFGPFGNGAVVGPSSGSVSASGNPISSTSWSPSTFGLNPPEQASSIPSGYGRYHIIPNPVTVGILHLRFVPY